ncbi:unnamed protein product [Scytosiphon promiscuus]
MNSGLTKKVAASLILLSFAAEASPVASVDGDLQEKCRVLGFSSMLACSTCKSFEEIVADEALTDECLQCCQEMKTSSKKYASAKLVYDPRLLSADPELRGFVDDRAPDHPNLALQPTPFARPALLMSEESVDPGAGSVDTVSVRGWKLDSIADYLHEHL